MVTFCRRVHYKKLKKDDGHNRCILTALLACNECTPVDQCTDKDKGLNVDVKFFQLTNIVIPSDVEDRYMEALVLQEKVLREELYQNASVIRKTTQAMVKFSP